ncbi:MAG: hypothetical protein OXK80_00735 [Bdellovibrionales bacterium]|nr:hypothetical protein [Bdellovibrionales bacterium]
MSDLDKSYFQKLSQLLKSEYGNQAVFNPKQDMGAEFNKLFGFCSWNKKAKSINGMASLGRKSVDFTFSIKNGKVYFDVLKPNRYVVAQDVPLMRDLAVQIIIRTITALKSKQSAKKRKKEKEKRGEEVTSSGGGGYFEKFLMLNKDIKKSSENDIKNFKQAESDGYISKELRIEAIKRSLSMHQKKS